MRISILLLALLCGKAVLAGEPVASVARFTVIYPEADLREEDNQLGSDAVWLHRPKKLAKSTQAAVKKGKSVDAKKQKPPATVTPLRRERPKNEVDPPKSRRRPLGW